MVWLTCGCGRLDFAQLTGDAARGDGDRPIDTGVVQRGCVAQLAALGAVRCVRRTDGQVFCWGTGTNGQLGNGLFNDSSTPQAALVSDAISLAGGEDIVCAIRPDHSLVCWGQNDMNQLGDGSMTHQAAPVPLAIPPLVVDVRLGEYHGCARLSDGTGRCWGDNANGELNQPASAAHLTPTDAPSIGSAMQFSISDQVTCVLDGGVVGCFGRNDEGDLGDGTMADHDQPVPVAIPDPVTSIAGGCHRHTCAVTNKNEIWCWGENSAAELGNGTPTTFEKNPVKVVGIPPSVQAGVGAFFTCARTVAGEIWCWGDGTAGQLGDGMMQFDFVPKRVDAFTGNPIDLQASCDATHVRRDDGTLVGWGAPQGVGNGGVGDTSLPVDVDIPCP